MKNSALKEILHRAENWSLEDQNELMQVALYIEQRHSREFDLTNDDWKIIEARLGAIAKDEELGTAVGELKDLRHKTSLGGFNWKELRDAGRK